MRVEHFVLFTFDELSEEAQHKAHEEYLSKHCYGPAWAEENRESLEAFCKVFPVKAKNWSYSSWQADITPVMEYICYDDAVWELTGQRLRTWLINNFEEWLYDGKYLSIWRDGKSKAKRSKAMIEESCCPFTGFCMDESLLDPIRAFIKNPDGRTLEELLRECLWSWVYACQKECEYEESFEYFAETAQANEWEFYQNGGWA